MIGLLLPLIARLGLPERFQRIAAWAMLILAGLLLLWGAKALYDLSVVREYEREIADEVRERTDEGDAAAHRTVQEVREGIEESNRRASEAAKNSDDPLKVGLDKLR